MAPRAIWKGVLKIAEVTCPVSLHAAASTAERIGFHTLNRRTGNRVHRQFIDEVTAKPVPQEDQVKGYDRGDGRSVILAPDEIAAAVPHADKVLSVETFLPCDEIDTLFLDRPYFVAPATPVATEAFRLIVDAMRDRQSAALARTVMFRRMRSILIRVQGEGLIATTLNFDYEVRSAQEAFAAIPEIAIDDEMLGLARHIIDTKAGAFDPQAFDDRYDAALAELVKAKIEGRPIAAPKPPAATKVVDLREALRRSAEAAAARKPPARKRASAAKPDSKPDSKPRREAG